MIAKTDTQHYSDIADSVRYSLDGTQYESSLAQARAQFAELVQRTITTASDADVTSIGFGAFYGCNSLASVDFPSVTSIKELAFYECTSLTSLTSVNFPNVTSIGVSAFYGCTHLTNVDFPNILGISANAFFDCTRLTSVNFPNVLGIRDFAFNGCTSLTSVNFPNATFIGESAFFDCTRLTNVDFPNVTDIRDYAFYGCADLLTIILHKRATLADGSAIPSQTIVYVENADLDWYSTATNWSAIYADGRIKSIDELPPTGSLTRYKQNSKED